MSILIPAIKGRLGNTDFYEATMNARDLTQAVRPPLEMDDWASFGIEERMQREPDKKRIERELAPYIAKNPDRFFGSVIVLVYGGDLAFESLSKMTTTLPNAYKKNAERMGFLTIDGGTLVMLDGQHRLMALRMVVQGDVVGPCSSDVSNDEVCVMFIRHEDFTKTRRIFNTVNRYAKPTSRGDNILTSEDDPFAILSRRLLRDDQPLHGRHTGKSTEDVVDWKSNTLAARSVKLTTISVVYEITKLMLEHRGTKLSKQERPQEEDLDVFLEYCATLWSDLLDKVKPYAHALADVSKIPQMREDGADTALLFKPAAQITLIDGMLRAIDLSGKKVNFTTLAERVNLVPWSMKDPMWNNIQVRAGGSIDTTSDARERGARLISYLLAADALTDEQKLAVWQSFNMARNPAAFAAWKEGLPYLEDGTAVESNLEDLPAPTAGERFTIAEANAQREKQKANSAAKTSLKAVA